MYHHDGLWRDNDVEGIDSVNDGLVVTTALHEDTTSRTSLRRQNRPCLPLWALVALGTVLVGATTALVALQAFAPSYGTPEGCAIFGASGDLDSDDDESYLPY